jgi:hypothetical protein
MAGSALHRSKAKLMMTRYSCLYIKWLSRSFFSPLSIFRLYSRDDIKWYHERESESCCCCCFSPIVEWVISIEMERVGGGMSFQHTDRQTDADYIYSPNRKQSDLFENFMFSLFLYNFFEEDDGFRSYYILNGRNRLGRAPYYARL